MSGDSAAWGPPPHSPALPGQQVHVWRIYLEQPADLLDRLWETLAPEERARAGRFHFERDHRHFIVAHAALRAILARYLSTPPVALQFCVNANGKPRLAAGDLHFNLSHSHGLALLAVTRGRELGVDVEFIAPDLDYLDLAGHFFAPAEVAALAAVREAERRDAFYRCWTRKEAYIKARGEGLSHPLAAFEVTLAPGDPAALVVDRTDPPAAARWSLAELAPGAGFQAALAVEGHSWHLECWQWRTS